MKTFGFITAAWVVLFVTGVSSSPAQTQMIEGYTFIRGSSGTQVCLGRWVQPRDPVSLGACEGQLVDVAQLNAISSRVSADRLEQVLFALASIDQRLAFNNDQIRQLIDSTADTQASIERQANQVGELLREVITRRFDALPGEMLANDQFREELTKLKEDILREVDKKYAPRPAPSRK